MANTPERYIIGETHSCHEPFTHGKKYHRYDCSPSASARHLRRRTTNRLRRRMDDAVIAEQLAADDEMMEALRQEAYEAWEEYAGWMDEISTDYYFPRSA